MQEELQTTSVEGENLEISFNPDYVRDALRVFNGKLVDLKFTTNLRPFTVTPAGEVDNKQLQLITPVLEGNYPETDRLIPTESTTQLTIDAGTLLGAINRASLLSHESRNNVVQLTMTDGVVTLTGTSQEVGQTDSHRLSQRIVTLTGTDAQVNADVIMPAKSFNELQSLLEGQDRVDIKLAKNQAVFDLGHTTFYSRLFTINGQDVRNYPQLPELDDVQSLSVSAAQLVDIISQTKISASTQESRPILTGIHLALNGNDVKAVTTGSNSDISIETRIEQSDTSAQLVIGSTGGITLPATFFANIVKNLPADDLTLAVDGLRASITSGASA
ncbi:hypothetical protein GQS40_13465|uniref:Beta sliding clamp n=1 Tax=Leuconostoc lactis TaxID=1246 RepID=A0A6L7A7Z2_LEULA|nr:hypothetical protein [Leuconostoc lactis]